MSDRINWKYLCVQAGNFLRFGQFKKMGVLFNHLLFFIFPKQEQKELLLNFCLIITCCFHLSIKEHWQTARKQHLVLCRERLIGLCDKVIHDQKTRICFSPTLQSSNYWMQSKTACLAESRAAPFGSSTPDVKWNCTLNLHLSISVSRVVFV